MKTIVKRLRVLPHLPYGYSKSEDLLLTSGFRTISAHKQSE